MEKDNINNMNTYKINGDATFVENLCKSKENDNVNNPKHYTYAGIECIDVMCAIFGKTAVRWFCICNAFKYIWRFAHKNGDEDIDKARWYLTKFLELGKS